VEISFSRGETLKTKVRVKVMRSHSHKSHDSWKDVEDPGRMRSYSMCNTC